MGHKAGKILITRPGGLQSSSRNLDMFTMMKVMNEKGPVSRPGCVGVVFFGGINYKKHLKWSKRNLLLLVSFHLYKIANNFGNETFARQSCRTKWVGCPK